VKTDPLILPVPEPAGEFTADVHAITDTDKIPKSTIPRMTLKKFFIQNLLWFVLRTK
jgi:hypothetical protein